MNVWAVRGGADGEYEDYALSEGAALTDFDLRRSVTDFADRTALRDFLNAEEDSAYRGRLRSAANAASQLWRFANEIQVGDMILLPRKKTREVAVGTVTGEYRLVADAPFEACHARDVAWRAVDVPRDAFDAGILTAIRSMLTVFQVKRDGAAARIGNATTAYLSGELYARQDEDDDAQDAPPADAPPTETAPAAEDAPPPPADLPPMDIDALIEARIVHRIRERFGGDGFGYLMTSILEMSGYDITKTTRAAGGASVHIHLERDSAEADGGKETMVAHLMSGDSPASASDVETLRALAAEIGASDALLVSMSGFAARPPNAAPEGENDADAAESESAPRPPRLMDASDVVSRILESYAALPAYVRANIPLQQRMVLVEIED